SPSFRMIDRRCRDAGFNPHVAYRINDCQMAQALVAAGEGIALLPRLMLRPAHQGVAIRPLATDPPSRRVSAVRLATRYLTPATERFTALLVAAAADHADTRHGLRRGAATPRCEGSPDRSRRDSVKRCAAWSGKCVQNPPAIERGPLPRAFFVPAPTCYDFGAWTGSTLNTRRAATFTSPTASSARGRSTSSSRAVSTFHRSSSTTRRSVPGSTS